jgi:ABC-type polysaccharide/polyol phosphate transport system ATPase subunit
VDFSGIEKFLDQPVKNYSSGMYVRLGFAIAIHVDPDILVVDEVLSVGDSEFQKKSFEKFLEFKNLGKTIILVTHTMQVVRDICDTATWINQGTHVVTGDANSVVDRYEASIS